MMTIDLVVQSNGDRGRQRIVEAAVADVRELVADAAESARPNVPRRTGWLASTVEARNAPAGAVLGAGKRHPGMARKSVRERTSAALGRAARAALDKREL